MRYICIFLILTVLMATNVFAEDALSLKTKYDKKKLIVDIIANDDKIVAIKANIDYPEYFKYDGVIYKHNGWNVITDKPIRVFALKDEDSTKKGDVVVSLSFISTEDNNKQPIESIGLSNIIVKYSDGNVKEINYLDINDNKEDINDNIL